MLELLPLNTTPVFRQDLHVRYVSLQDRTVTDIITPKGPVLVCQYVHPCMCVQCLPTIFSMSVCTYVRCSGCLCFLVKRRENPNPSLSNQETEQCHSLSCQTRSKKKTPRPKQLQQTQSTTKFIIKSEIIITSLMTAHFKRQ